MDGHTLIYDTFGPNETTVPGDDSSHRSQTDASARKFAFRVQPLKRREQTVSIRCIKACAVVAYEERRATLGGMAAEFNFRPVAFAGKFPRIAEQICQDNAQQASICVGRKAGLDDEIDFASRLGLFKLGEGRLCQRAQINLTADDFTL